MLCFFVSWENGHHSGIFLDRFGTVLRSFWNHVGTILGSFGGRFGTILVLFWDHSGIMLGPFWDDVGIILALFWECCGIMLGPFWNSCGNISGLDVRCSGVRCSMLCSNSIFCLMLVFDLTFVTFRRMFDPNVF